jgi:hypothetical protein
MLPDVRTSACSHAVLCRKKCKLMTKLTPALPAPVPHSEDVWERRGVKLQTKLKVYDAVVIPSLLYACETWTVYSRHSRKLNHFHLGCLRKLLKIKWQDHIPDTEVLERANMNSVHTMLRKAQLRWAGHVVRMPEERLPKQILYGELTHGKRSFGGQMKRYKDTQDITEIVQHQPRNLLGHSY